MSPNDYQANCLITWRAELAHEMQLLNATLGLVGETGELIYRCEQPLFDPQRAAEELGDICYYIAIACHLLDFKLTCIADRPRTPGPSPHRILNHMVVYAAGFADRIKKQLFQGHTPDYEHHLEALAQLYAGVKAMACALDLPLDSIFEGNIAKLAKRYPDGRFDPERSRNRIE
jgi:hypothetical protein